MFLEKTKYRSYGGVAYSIDINDIEIKIKSGHSTYGSMEATLTYLQQELTKEEFNKELFEIMTNGTGILYRDLVKFLPKYITKEMTSIENVLETVLKKEKSTIKYNVGRWGTHTIESKSLTFYWDGENLTNLSANNPSTKDSLLLAAGIRYHVTAESGMTARWDSTYEHQSKSNMDSKNFLERMVRQKIIKV